MHLNAKHRFLPWLLLAVFLVTLGAIHRGAEPSPPHPVPPSSPQFVGSSQCASCHMREHETWLASQHAKAMQHASDNTVLGRFDGSRFVKDGVATTFLKRDGHFLIETEGPDGKPGTFEIKFALGLSPLQQYLVEMPGGRLQAFGIAWDSRPSSEGGQRWFDLYPGQRLPPGDALHWTGIQQTGNFMCIDCHVTNLRKGFDLAANAYRSTWSELGVGCEACHGPGSVHAANPRARMPARFSPRATLAWGTGPAGRPDASPAVSRVEIETCGRCHARRSQLTEEIHAGQPFGDGFRAALLERGLYRADGQMEEEVFNYGSFLQSRMFAKGVSCSDCHDPHAQKLRAPGNGVCEQCHEATRYDSRAHHFHDPQSKTGQCASCHMPAVTYMVVDPRHDHSFRVPRPDLAAALDTPDVCATCHTDKPVGWATAELQKRLGRLPSGFQNFGEAFHAADRGAPGAGDLLARVANDPALPAIVRASAIARSMDIVAPTVIASAGALADPDPLVRRAAVAAVGAGDIRQAGSRLVPLLRDPVREVRIEAARALAGNAELHLTESDRTAFRAALDDYIAVQRYNSDRGEAHMNLALLEIRRGNGLLADDHLDQAIRIDPGFVPAYVQLAELLRGRGHEQRAEAILRLAVQHSPNSGQAHHALGLSLVRQGRLEAALEELRLGAELASENPRHGYVYAIGLDQKGRRADAERVLEGVLARHPYHADSLLAAATWAVRRGHKEAARNYLLTLQQLRPNDIRLRQEIERLRRPSP
ncbi:MAG: cytochrome c3 family protein [Hyphomicrobiaceae bacterium]